MARLQTNLQVKGVKELQRNIENLVGKMEGEELQKSIADFAAFGAGVLASEAKASLWPMRAIESIFTYGKLAPNQARRRAGPSALFGFRKRGRSRPYAPGYVEWGKRSGKLVGESLATMYEYGTSKLQARPILRPVITAMRGMYLPWMANAIQRILAKQPTQTI